MVEESDGDVMVACALQVVQHQRELVPKHEDACAVRDADEIVEGVGEKNGPCRFGGRQVHAGNLLRE